MGGRLAETGAMGGGQCGGANFQDSSIPSSGILFPLPYASVKYEMPRPQAFITRASATFCRTMQQVFRQNDALSLLIKQLFQV